MIKIGEYNLLKVIKEKPMGLFLDDGENGILLPKRFVPGGTTIGDELEVFLYFDGEDRPIATTQKPFGVVGEVLKMKAVNVMEHGAFLDWGLMKDLFIPKSKMKSVMYPMGEYIVRIELDPQTGRPLATEKFEHTLSNENLSVTQMEEVELLVFRKTDIGYEVIINSLHKGILHSNEIYRNIEIGDRFGGFIKNILPDKKGDGFLIDVAAGQPGYERVEEASEKIMRLLKENNGRLPYHDKSSPAEIYSFFEMSKKTFKMTTGNLYKQRKIIFTGDGIELIDT